MKIEDIAGPIDSFDNEFQFLSNFFPCTVEFEGMTFPSSEHAFQAAKTLDIKQREKIRDLPKPGQAKKAGKTVTLRPHWDIIKVGVMEQILRSKFSDPSLRQQLLDTGSRELVEGNTWGDKYWGKCRGKGENWLGKTLMKLRKEFGQ